MQCIYSDQQFPENKVTQTFSTSTSNCPLLSSTDTQMLWQSMSFMREAADKSAQLSENYTTASTMLGFLECLLVHTGVFLPLDIDRFASPDNVYFVPSLVLSQANTHDVWTYKSSDSWMTTLSHSWLFRDGAPVGLMEYVTVALLRNLYEFSHTIKSAQTLPQRSQTFPLGRHSLTEFVSSHEGEAIGNIKIHQIMCWKSSLLVKIGCVFSRWKRIARILCGSLCLHCRSIFSSLCGHGCHAIQYATIDCEWKGTSRTSWTQNVERRIWTHY
jgi:hypothetical protein